jgi:hypothetical protein
MEDAMDKAHAEAVKIVRWVMTWKTWRAQYDRYAALEVVLTQLEAMPEKKLTREARYALGQVAIEAAKDAETVMAEALAEAEWKAQREAEKQAKELDAELFLFLALHDKPVLYRELEHEAKELGISAYYLRIARANLGVFTIEGATPAHPRHWALPEWSRA